ncbi:MAG: enoyl-CoA hydratase/isomerase family protein [Ilumatobacter sp.]|uniref:enoyl-CoA hydratase/isomerase family protein n=1 Tax=Ilumatobacter sp. TaxID=1967498 RepID=UPI003C71B89A
MTTISTDVDVHGVVVVTIGHPPVNLMTVAMFRELATEFERLAADDTVRAVIIRSSDPEWFIAHFDVEAILGFPAEQPAATELNNFHVMCETLRTMPKPTIAEIDGRVGGGGSELALSCDMRFASPSAIFNQPEVALGILPGGSGTVRLPRLVGRGRALEAILGCDDIDAATAERWGWVNRVMPADELTSFVDRLARRIASFPAHAVAAAKASVVAADGTLTDDLLAEGTAFNMTLGGDGTQEAMQRFIDLGGQTPEGERRLGELAGELAAE